MMKNNSKLKEGKIGQESLDRISSAKEYKDTLREMNLIREKMNL